MSVATSGNFIDGSEELADPFGAGTRPLTLAEQAALEEQRRQQKLQEQATRTANINNRPGGFMSSRETGPGQQINPKTGKPWTGRERPKTAKFGDAQFWRESAETIANDPWLLALPAAPLVGAAAFPAAAGTGTIASSGVAAGSTLPAITTGGAVTEATIAAPVATGAATGSAAAPTAAGAATGASAFDKYGMPLLQMAVPLGIQALTGGRTKEEKALLAKQEQMAREAEAQRFRAQEGRMNALGQQLLAMNPRNQMMAKMFGPDAAFAPTDFAQMVQNPAPPPQLPPELQNLQGAAAKDPKKQQALRDFIQRKQQYEQGNQARADQMMNGMAPPGPGPAPLDPRTPQPARRY